MSKLARFRSRHGELKHNPPLVSDVAAYLIPGFAAFASARLLTRVASAQIVKRYPKAAKHAGAVAAVGTFAAAWWGAHRVKALEAYHHPIVIGSGLAALQSLVQLYAPKLAWLVGDPHPAAQQPAALASTARPLLTASAPAASAVPAGFKPTTASEWYMYNDAYDAGGYKGKVEVPMSQTSPPPQTDPEEIVVSDLLDNSDLQLDNSDLGLS